MASGTVKWFDVTTGFGFLQPATGGKDVFVHIGAVERAGLKDLNERQKINYEVQAERGRVAAVNLKGLILMNAQCAFDRLLAPALIHPANCSLCSTMNLESLTNALSASQ